MSAQPQPIWAFGKIDSAKLKFLYDYTLCFSEKVLGNNKKILFCMTIMQ